MTDSGINSGESTCLNQASKRDADCRTIRDVLMEHTATRRMVGEATGIHSTSICWRFGDLVKVGLIEPVRKGRDPITGKSAKFYTADPEKFLRRKQLEINWEGC